MTSSLALHSFCIFLQPGPVAAWALIGTYLTLHMVHSMVHGTQPSTCKVYHGSVISTQVHSLPSWAPSLAWWWATSLVVSHYWGLSVQVGQGSGAHPGTTQLWCTASRTHRYTWKFHASYVVACEQNCVLQKYERLFENNCRSFTFHHFCLLEKMFHKEIWKLHFSE